MRFADIIRTALGSVSQHKLRNTLTLLGVIIGTFVLVLSLSIGLGVQELVMREFRRHDHLRKISVTPMYEAGEADVPAKELEVVGLMSDEKRERIRQAKLRQWSRNNVRKPKVPLNKERVEALNKIEHVQSVFPSVQREGRVSLGKEEKDGWAFGASLQNENLHNRLVAGRYLSADDGNEVMVSEYLLYRLGIRDDDQVAKVVGQKLRFELRRVGQPTGLMLLALLGASGSDLSSEENRVLQKTIQQLPDLVQKLDMTKEEQDVLRKALQKKPADAVPLNEPVVSEEFIIVGVIRETTKEDVQSFDWSMEPFSPNTDIFMPVRTAEVLAFRSRYAANHGLNSVTVTVENEKDLRDVVGQIEEMGLHSFSLVEIADHVRRNILLVSIFTGFIAFVALLVASIGITNTMLMSILERTHEIGVMKAIGARDRHIQMMFLVEGGLIGVVGGLLGLLVSWLAHFPGDSIARTLIEQQTRGHLEGSVFAFPMALTMGVPFFACVVTTLAAAYPARRAARVNPITALRHE